MRLLVIHQEPQHIVRYEHNRHTFQLLSALPSQAMAICQWHQHGTRVRLGL